MKSFLLKLLNQTKCLISRAIKLIENVWVKRIAALFLVIYSIYFIYNQYNNLKDSFSTLSINSPLLILSSLIIIITLILSIFSWNTVIAAFGYTYSWIDIARAQMLSSIGKYIPGHIWNYSSKVYLSNKLGLPIKISGIVILVEIIITYLLAICLLLVFVPVSIFPNISNGAVILIRVIGIIVLVSLVLAPSLISRYGKQTEHIKKPKKLYNSILLRAAIWTLSSYAFNLLILSLGYTNIGMPTSISVITSSFFVGFLAIITPDGIVVREAIIIFMLRKILSEPDATILSLFFRFQLVILEFFMILIVLIIWKIRKTRSETVDLEK